MAASFLPSQLMYLLQELDKLKFAMESKEKKQLEDIRQAEMQSRAQIQSSELQRMQQNLQQGDSNAVAAPRKDGGDTSTSMGGVGQWIYPFSHLESPPSLLYNFWPSSSTI